MWTLNILQFCIWSLFKFRTSEFSGGSIWKSEWWTWWRVTFVKRECFLDYLVYGVIKMLNNTLFVSGQKQTCDEYLWSLPNTMGQRSLDLSFPWSDEIYSLPFSALLLHIILQISFLEHSCKWFGQLTQETWSAWKLGILF